MNNFLRCLVLACAIVLCDAGRSGNAEAPDYPPTVSLDTLRQRVSKCDAAHPRLFVTAQELAGLASWAQDDPLRQKIADAVVQQANTLHAATPIERKLEGRRLLGVSRQCVQRVLMLATAFHLTGDVKHVERCRQEMLTAARFSDWNPSHFLDVAEMTFALAVGYDWLYPQLDDATRREIRSAIVQKGVKLPFETQHNRWVRARNNWGQVCHGGLTAGALAVLEDEPELAARTVHNALQNVVVSMGAYAPHGSYPEGPGYWAYGTSYNGLLIAMLESSLGSDFGLPKAPGFDQTGGYPALASGPSGLYFNYSDGSARWSPEPIRFWFASRYNRPDWLWREHERWEAVLSHERSRSSAAAGRLFPLALLWSSSGGDSAEACLPLHWNSAGSVPIAIHRSSWSDARATFVGLKAGSPSANHGQMDIGSFVLDSDGVRWAHDLGAEGYHKIESRGMSLWNAAQVSDRWKIFRLNNYGHNTLVIDGQLQVAAESAPIIAFSDDPARPHSVVDLSPVYRGQVESAHRGVALLPTGEVLFQDELTGLRPGSRVRWGMITEAQPENLGQRILTIQQAGKKLTLTLLSPAEAAWREIDTAKPRNEWDSANPGTRMIAFEATAPQSGELLFVVVATPGTCDDSLVPNVHIETLQRWGPMP